ncbi:hypothetical protein COO60DRAFT_1637190 [Scenedesmus sp. NREL 46B-D3]|nr:hypothetical protein COO60DRAFT_1637190 [Scenedesmus sp. NREL 46B-D3]
MLVVTGFQPGAFSGSQQVALLQRLVDALSLLSAECEAEGAALDLSGLHILICSKPALDSLGTLCLHSDDSAGDWADFLGGVDVGCARDKRGAAAALRQLEGAVAAALGAVHVAPPGQHHQHAAGSDQRQQQQQQRQQVVHELAHAAASAGVLSQRQQLQQELGQLTASVHNRLQLRRLYRDELVSAADYKAACQRLLRHREHLQRCNIEGLSIRVSDKNRAAPDGSLVNIAWD